MIRREEKVEGEDKSGASKGEKVQDRCLGGKLLQSLTEREISEGRERNKNKKKRGLVLYVLRWKEPFGAPNSRKNKARTR